MEFAESMAISLWKNAENECLTVIKGIANVLTEIILKQDTHIHFYIQLIVLLHIHSPQVTITSILTYFRISTFFITYFTN
jgi:hypothetical protein